MFRNNDAVETWPAVERYRPHYVLLTAATTGAVAVILAHQAPFRALSGLAAFISAALVVAYAPWLRRPFLAGFAVVLTGYAYFGRTFAYLGYPPLFVGEAVLAVGILIALGSGDRFRLVTSPLGWALLAFAAWGAARTVPFVPTYGLDAVRDAVIWGYAAFALVVAASLRADDISRVLSTYGRWLTLFPLWIPCLFVLNRIGGDLPPELPWADVSLVGFKPGEAGVHLAGLAAFLMLGLRERTAGRVNATFVWVTWLLALGVVASLTRGGLMSVVAALACAALLGPRDTRRRLLWLAGATAAIALLAAMWPTRGGDARDPERRVSLQQVSANLSSVTGDASFGNLDGTKTWRLDWWNDIVAYTVHGKFFLGGKGFGINLADDDGYQVQEDRSLRSPHSIHMSVLARTGVPGFALWVMVNVVFATLMLRGTWRARMAGQDWWSRVCVWTLAYWLALLVNASFDVYFEGPSGGIWFWSVTGFGIVVLDAARRERRLRLSVGRIPSARRSAGGAR